MNKAEKIYEYRQLGLDDEDEDDSALFDSLLEDPIVQDAMHKLEQPMSHEAQKSLCLKIMPMLSKRTDLSDQEINTFLQLKISLVPYDYQNSDHEVTISLYNVIQGML